MPLLNLGEQSPQWLTVKEVAIRLDTSEDTVVRRFTGRKGVIDIGQQETRYKRGRRHLRISEKAFQAFVNERQTDVSA